jgi:hypothetical protein
MRTVGQRGRREAPGAGGAGRDAAEQMTKPLMKIGVVAAPAGSAISGSLTVTPTGRARAGRGVAKRCSTLPGRSLEGITCATAIVGAAEHKAIRKEYCTKKRIRTPETLTRTFDTFGQNVAWVNHVRLSHSRLLKLVAELRQLSPYTSMCKGQMENIVAVAIR